MGMSLPNSEALSELKASSLSGYQLSPLNF